MPSPNQRTIIVGEEDLEVRSYMELVLKGLGFSVEFAHDGDEVLDCLHSSEADIAAVIMDFVMPNGSGLDTLREIRTADRSLPVIIVSSVPSALDIVAAMKSGATDFLPMPVTQEELAGVVVRAIEGSDSIHHWTIRSAIPGKGSAFVSANSRMREIQAMVRHVGLSGTPVLIQGETGSGKEVLARELHAQSARANRPFLKLNCAALPSELVESELFGYERGAFTGAFQKKVGIFELADGGSILLDEIGDMDVRLQAKLLQVLQDQEFRRIGGKDIVRVDVRIMAATHRDLERAIQDRTFREDLYYRLNVINFRVPPLRERREDIVPLCEFLVKKHSVQGSLIPAITVDLKNAVMDYPWPGNVRELENYVRKLLVFGDANLVARELHARTVRRAPTSIRSEENAGSSSHDTAPGIPALEHVTKVNRQAEIDAILTALHSTHWNRKEAAVLLDIDYKSLLYKMKKLGVEHRPKSLPAPTALPNPRVRTASGH
jgi:two-component system, NtrC family, response regulator AtoC